jgi:outer membrane receptor protein involved in Fe transport
VIASERSRRGGPWWSLAALAIAAGLVLAPARANAERPLAGLALEELMDLEVTVATKQSAKVSEVPSTVSVVTAAQIRDHGWLSLNDVLASLPGFARSQDYERRTTSARGVFEGWNSNHLAVLVNGLPFNDPDVQTAATWELTSLEFFRQVEVVRGPTSALYGSSAVNGAIGLEPLRAADLPGGVRARARLGAGTSQLSAVGGQVSDAGELVVGFARFVSVGDGRRDVDASLRTEPDGSLRRFRLHDQREFHHAMVVAQPGGPLDGLTLSLHAQDSKTDSLYGWFYQAPDQPDVIADRRLIGNAMYRHSFDGVELEHALQWQRSRSEIDVHLVPAGGFDGFYPDGIEEVQDFGAHTVFARSQATIPLPGAASAIAGVEYRVLVLRQARHQIDANPAGDLEPFGELREVGGLYATVVDHPAHRIAGFAQLDSGDLVTDWLHLFLGARYDALLAHYDAEDGAVRDKNFYELSPRAGLVIEANDRYSAKLVAGRAFRTPSAGELFTTRSWVATANPETLEPETDLTYEAAIDAAPVPWVRLRGNLFHAERSNQVGYTLDETSRLGNLYSSRRVGVEAEVLVERQLDRFDLGGYASYSGVRLLEETALDPSISAERRLTNVPAHLVKLGARATGRRWSLALALYGQGRTFRRASERATPEFRPYRPASVPGHVEVDLATAFEPVDGLRLGLGITNLFDHRARIAAVADAPFDHRREPRRVLFTVELEP